MDGISRPERGSGRRPLRLAIGPAVLIPALLAAVAVVCGAAASFGVLGAIMVAWPALSVLVGLLLGRGLAAVNPR